MPGAYYRSFIGKIGAATVFVFLCAAANAFAGNGGNIFTAPKSKREQNIEEGARRAEAARQKTEELNKKWKAQQRKEAKAKAKAKAAAERKALKAKRLEEKKKKKAQQQEQAANP